MPSKRYEREIEDLMRRMEASAQRKRRWQRLRRLLRRPASPGDLMLLSFALVLLALLSRIVFAPLWRPLAIAALILFIIAFATTFMQPRTYPEKRWRGQIIEIRPVRWWERLYHWLYGPKG